MNTMLIESPAFSRLRNVFIVLATGCLVAAGSMQAAAEGANAKSQAEAESSPAVAPLSQRFAEADVSEIPDFQRHVVPLLGRLGCNGRACHGSFQGRGGFQLSLFGYDFQADHAALRDENSGRVDVDDIDESLVLSKPTDADMHEGGKRYDKGSWQHHVLRRWIESGAKFDSKSLQKLVRLEVSPKEIQFSDEGENVELTAIAHWQDGSAENVTELCRFSSNDDSIAEIDDTGKLSSGVRGDTHVVVYYDNAVVPIPVMRRFGSTAVVDQTASEHPVDKLVQQKLDKLGIVPSGECTDAEFIRRVSLDVTGILPSGEAVRRFLADDSPDKRQRLIDELLGSPGYAAWWATRFSDWTGNSDEQLTNVLPVRGAAPRLWYEWLRARLEANVPYDQIMEGIVTANSRQENESYLEYCERMTEACEPGNESKFAERDGLPMFWGRRNFQRPEERAIGFAYTFLGVRIECAQCHKHPFDQWSKDDFEQFAKLFTPIRVNQNQVSPESKSERDELLEKLTEGKQLRGGDLRRAVSQAAQKGETVPFGELLVNVRAISERAQKARAAARKKGRKVPDLPIPSGKILGNAEPVKLDKDPRPALMQWLRSPENPYFAKAIVNRVWSNYFGEGIVNPTDDMNLANPPVNAPLLDYLASEFVANDFDLKWLHRTIVTSDTYQRSAETNESNALDLVNFSRHVPRRLPAEIVYDAVVLATGSDTYAGKLRDELDQMAIADGKPRRRNQQDFALEVFGQSIRESNCDCDRSSSPSLLQSIYLRNDIEMHQRLADKNGWVAQVCKSLGVPGPVGGADPRQASIERQAVAMKRQVVNRVRQFNDLPEQRQERLRPSVEKQYRQISARLKKLGFSTPPLDQLLADPSGWMKADLQSVDSISESPEQRTIDSVVNDVYLRTLSRFPDSEETEIATTFIEDSKTTADGIQSLLWALVNTKEFILTH